MSVNLGHVFNNTEETGKVSLTIAACLAAISILGLIFLFFSVTYMNRYLTRLTSDEEIEVKISDNVDGGNDAGNGKGYQKVDWEK